MIAIPTQLWPSDVIAAPAGSEALELAGEIMGTAWSIRCFAPPLAERRIRRRVQAELDRLVAQMSHWNPESDLCRYNRADSGAWVDVPKEFHFVVAAAVDVARRSGGMFDPGLGREVDRWGFGPSGSRTSPPPVEPGDRAATWRNVELRPGAIRQPGGVNLDLSSIAKGFAVDHVARLLSSEGLVSFLVEIGGELRARGVKPDGQPWWVCIEPPPGLDVDVKVALSGWSIATSGDYRKCFEFEGQRYAHTLHPASGVPLAAPPTSVSVLHRECMLADSWSTALMVLGVQAGLEACEREGLLAAFVMREPFHLALSSRFRELV